MKNLKKHKEANVSIALPVPAYAVSGGVVPLGANGLKGIVKTDRATAATITAGTAAQGLADGQATVELLGISNILSLAIDAAAAQFALVYVTPAGAYSATAAGNTKIGYVIDALAGAGTTRVAIING